MSRGDDSTWPPRRNDAHNDSFAQRARTDRYQWPEEQDESLDMLPTEPLPRVHRRDPSRPSIMRGGDLIAPDGEEDTEENTIVNLSSKSSLAPSPRERTRAPWFAFGAGKYTNRRRSSESTSAKQWIVRGVLITVIGALLVGIAYSAIDGYSRYSHERVLASDGIRHLHAAESLLLHGQLFTNLLNPALIEKLSQDLSAAEADFSSLRASLNAPQGTLYVAAHVPGVSTSLSAAALLSAGADELCLAGIAMTHAAQPLQAFIHNGVFAKAATANGKTPAPMTTTTFTEITNSWDVAQVHLRAAISFVSHSNLSALPSSLLSKKDISELRGLLAKWPSVQTQLAQVNAWLSVAPTLLGLTTPERLLVELQDRTELRATGGFMGNYALVTLQGARVQPFHLEDSYLLDRPYTALNGGLPLPSAYSWWPFYPFAFRDSNLSADFPTSAQFERSLFLQESGESVDGVIALTPVLVETILHITGGISIPGFPNIVTASNLESTIHEYQLGIHSQNEQQRKAFTAALGQSLLASVQKLSLAQQAQIVIKTLPLLKTKDIQIWLADPKAEALLATDGVAASVASGTGDFVMAVDSNVGGNKANQFVSVTYDDSVTISSTGSATHHLTITYHFHATNLAYLYGPDVYHTYLRVYAASHAALISESGFDFAYLSPNSFGPSDIPDTQMWAGHLLVQDGNPYTVTLVWTVPQAAQRDTSGHWRYTLDFQHQAGSTQHLTVTVTLYNQKKPAISFNGWLTSDKSLSLDA